MVQNFIDIILAQDQNRISRFIEENRKGTRIAIGFLKAGPHDLGEERNESDTAYSVEVIVL